MLTTDSTFSWQGHRGCRGLYPENTVTGFKKAIDLGMNTLEMDVVITQDSQVIVSHEPWMSHEICLAPDGSTYTQDQEKEYHIFKMPYAKVKTFDCGSKPHPRFGSQAKVREYKPRLAEVIREAEAYARQQGKQPPFYNIEIKSTLDGTEVDHPSVAEYAELLIQVIQSHGIGSRAMVQSFDVRTLQYLHETHPDVTLVYLTEEQPDIAHNVEQLLGFVPDVYSPNFEVIDQETVAYCRKKKMRLIPWTVNELEDMKKLIELGVDGIITDYPDRASELLPSQAGLSMEMDRYELAGAWQG